MSDSEALKVFSRLAVTCEMVDFLAASTASVLRVEKPKAPVSKLGLLLVTPKVVSLKLFIRRLIEYSNVRTPTLMASLVFLNRLRHALPGNAVGSETTLHRIFLAALILSAKLLNDSSPLNKHWTAYTDGLLTNAEVNAAERDLIGLLHWDLTVRESELVAVLEPFLVGIKNDLARRLQSETRSKQECYRLSSRSSRSLASALSKLSLFSASSYSLASVKSSDLLRAPLRDKTLALNRSALAV